jgi:N-acetylglucosaminyl-diphospho-decaprenol L-rhamnosyltransferase
MGTGLQGIDLTVVIVNWNVRDLLQHCLCSVLSSALPDPVTPGVWSFGPEGASRYYRLEVLVIDSASSDDSVAMVERAFPTVRLVASDVNLGYTGGNNLGLRESRGRYVLLLNPDTEVLGTALSTMVSFMDAHPAVGVLGPQLVWPDGSVQSSRRRFPSLYTGLIDSTFLEKWFPQHPELIRFKVLDLPDDVPHEVDWVVGACLLVRREVVQQVGELDDGFFMYSEELDWQKRIKDAGWQVVYLPAVQVVHHHGKSAEQVVALRHIRFGTSKVRYFSKHHGWLAGQVIRLALLLNYACEWGAEGFKWALGHKRSLRRERMQAYGQVLRSGLRAKC